MTNIIPDWAIKIYIETDNKISLRDRLYSWENKREYDSLIKWQYLINDFDDETIQCMQSQIVAEILGLA